MGRKLAVSDEGDTVDSVKRQTDGQKKKKDITIETMLREDWEEKSKMDKIEEKEKENFQFKS